MRLGFCCKYLHPDRNLKPKILKETEQPLNCRSTTVRWLNEHKPEAEEKLWDLMRHNISSIHELIKHEMPKPRTLLEAWIEMYNTSKVQNKNKDYFYNTIIPNN